VATLKRKIDVSQTAACVRIRYLEHVLLVLNLNFTLRRLIEVTLTSPLGTTSIMLRSGRRFDRGRTIQNLSLLSLHHWGENPNGEWDLQIRNTVPNASQNGFLFNFALQLFGTHNDPMKDNTHVKPSTLNPTMDDKSTTRTSPSTGSTPRHTLQNHSIAKSSSTDISMRNSSYTNTTPSLNATSIFTINSTSKNEISTSLADAKSQTNILIISVTVPAIVLLVIIAIVVFVKKKGLSTRPLTLTNANAQHELTVSPIANEPMKEVHA